MSDGEHDARRRFRAGNGTATAVAGLESLLDACRVEFRILGPVEARADGRVLDLAGSRQRALLAVLLLRRGSPLPRDQLVDDLWGGEARAGAVKALQVAVSRLRRALGDEARRLVTTPHGYVIEVAPGELDLERFETLCEEGRRALDAGDPVHAAQRLRTALAEWRGQALSGLSFEPFAPTEVVRLEALRAAALEDRIEADLRAGRHGELIAELEALVARHPLRERLRGQLMLALYRAGRQSDALASYRQSVRTFDTELGLRPGPELERLEGAILSHDPALRHSPQLVAEAPAPEPRRATATILFSDLVASTRMRSELGDEAADTVRREHDRRVRDAIRVHGGQEVKALGDGFLAAFESAGAAISCAVEVQRAIDRQAKRGPVALSVRVGVGAGDVAWEGADVFGTPVVEAQRLCAAADAGEILVSDAVRLLAGSAADSLEDAGERALAGLARPVHAWRVHWSARRAVSVPLAPALVVERAPAFAGRERELADLRDAWSDAAGGRRRGVFVTGEPGIGKTRLAAELAAYALGDGGVVLYGRCDDGPAAAAQPFAEAVAAYAAGCPVDELRVQLGAQAADLLPVLPSLAARLPGIVPAAPAAPEVERLRTLDATGALLEAASAAAPMLLVLDDLHWADELSLLLVQHLLRVDTSMRLLVLATYRDSEPSRSPLLATVVTGLARQPDVGRLELGPLGERDVEAILADAGRPPSLAARVRAVTEGNPFFVGEVARALGEGDSPEAAVTSRIRDVVRRRLDHLPPGATEVLTAAAVVGDEFDADIVAAASGAGVEAALDALEAAERARLVRPSRALDRFAFAHALVRRTIVDDLPAGRRVRLHARVADALERAAPVAAAELAVQLDAAGGLVDARTTLRYARQAADEAAARRAFDVAAEHYERACRARDRLADVPAEQRLELDLAHGRALRLAGDERAHDALRRVAADAQRAGDGARMAEAVLTFVLGMETDVLTEDDEMIGLVRRALALLPAEDSAARARLEALLALQALYSIPHAERCEMADRALAMARRVGDPVALASVLSAHGWTVVGPERRRDRLLVADDLLGVADVSPSAECEGHVLRFVALVESGDMHAADAALAKAQATARVPMSHWMVLLWESAREVLAGRLANAEELAGRAAEVGRDGGFQPSVVEFTFVGLLLCIRLAQGRVSELEAVTAGARTLPNRPAWSFTTDAQVALARGDRDGARAAMAHAVERGLLRSPRNHAWGTTVIGAADVCADLDDRSLAGPLYELLAPHADLMVMQSGPLSRVLGRLALTLGRRDEAQHHLRGAIALCERMDARAFLAIARYDLGRLLLPSHEGAMLIEQARAAAEALGMPGWAKKARAATESETVRLGRR
jgi:DNA-binding SARP family transcriptional activator